MHDTASIVQVIIPVPTVQLAYRQIDVWWFEVICAYWERERERAVIHSRRLWNSVSQKPFKLFSKLFNGEIWIVQHYNYFTSAGQCQTVTLHVLSITACTSSAWDHFFEIGLFKDPDRYQSNHVPVQKSTGSRYPSLTSPLLKPCCVHIHAFTKYSISNL